MGTPFNLNTKEYDGLFKDTHIHIAQDEIKDTLKAIKEGDNAQQEQKDKDNTKKNNDGTF